MIQRENYSEEHIRELQKASRTDPCLIERTLYAFGLLEALRTVGMDFIFKGGTSLLLLLSHPRRLSTDIDIIVSPGTDVDGYLEKSRPLQDRPALLFSVFYLSFFSCLRAIFTSL